MPSDSAKPSRVGARTVASVPKSVLARLNAGELETASLAEMLAMDLGALLRAVEPAASREEITAARDGGIIKRLRSCGVALHRVHGAAAVKTFAAHPSDMARSMACFALTANGSMTLPKRLDAVRPLADDPHSGVREWAWIGVREAVASDVAGAIRLLRKWTREDSANLRRFSSEVTRPRGVWCAHIEELKRDPSPGLVLLEPLNADPTKYVQDSVANWLNDAGKTRPEWVRAVCKSWSGVKPVGKATARIIKRATRNL